MGLFLFGLIASLTATIILLSLYINLKRQEEKKEKAEIKEKYKRAAEVYEEEKKQNEKKIIKNINSNDDFNTSIEQLRDIAEKGNKRINRATK